MEPEEEPNVAAAREVCEEVGSVAASLRYYSNVSFEAYSMDALFAL